MDKHTFSDLLKTHKVDLARLGIARIGLFGSILRNEATRESDVDVLLDFLPQKKPIVIFIKLPSS